jgi:hypothetical protein
MLAAGPINPHQVPISTSAAIPAIDASLDAEAATFLCCWRCRNPATNPLFLPSRLH